MSVFKLRVGVCGKCGRDAEIVKVACAEYPDLCRRCYWPHQPTRTYGICGKTRTIERRARDGNPDICGNCVPPSPAAACGRCGRVGRIARRATGDSPAVGRCCWQPPLATCSGCGRHRPCRYAKGPAPLCETCVKTRTTTRCVACQAIGPAHRRVPGGVVCAACDRRRGGTVGDCAGCGSRVPLVRRRCASCRLRERVAELRADADPAAAAALGPFLAVLSTATNAASTLRWMQTPAFSITTDLLAGHIAISHAGLDAVERSPDAVDFLRAALVDCGVLEARDEPSAAFARWQRRTVSELADGPCRAHVRAYATWHVAHQLAHTSQRGRPTAAAQKYARSLVSEAVKLVAWLHHQQLQLSDLRQDLLDTWLAAGAGVRHRVRLFLAWLTRTGLSGPFEVAWPQRGPGRPALDDEQRFALLRRLLHGDEIDRRDRFAGLLVLLYAQPLTRIVALRAPDVAVGTDGQTTIILARGPVELPEPLGTLALALRDQHPDADGEGWLLPGRKAGTHLSADRLRERLKTHDITSRPARHGALLALAARLPAPILAERLGFHQARAAQWVRAAGASYTDYVALRAPR